jgi:hypothetical protein
VAAAIVPGAVLEPSDAIGDTVQLVLGPGFTDVAPVTIAAAPVETAVATTAAAPATTPAPAPVRC